MGKSYITKLFGMSYSERVRDSGSIIGLLGQTSFQNYNVLMEKTLGNNLKDLKKTLEFYFYGKHSGGRMQAELEVQQTFQSIFEQQLQELIEKGANGITEEGIARQIGTKTHEAYINKETIIERYQIAQNLQYWLSGELGSMYPNIDEIKKVLDELVEQSQDILLDVAYQKTNKRVSLKNSKQSTSLYEKIKAFDENWIKIAQAKKYVSQSKTGALVERGIDATRKLVEMSTSNITNNLISGIWNSATTSGNDKASTDQLFTIKPQINFTDEKGNFIPQTKHGAKVKNGKTINYTYREYVRGDDGAEASVSVQALNDFNQKMDVNYVFPDTSNARLSIKSWSSMGQFQDSKGNLKYHDLGDTALYNALLRTVNYDPTIAFGLAMGWNGSRHIIGLSKWAQTIAVLDIMAGIGQKSRDGSSGHADTLVIQDRSMQEFHVYSMAELIRSLLQNGKSNGFELVGYNESAIRNNGLNYGHPLGGQQYAAKISSILKAQQITVAYTGA